MSTTKPVSNSFVKLSAPTGVFLLSDLPARVRSRRRQASQSSMACAFFIFATSTLCAQTGKPAVQPRSGAAPVAVVTSAPVVVGTPARPQPPFIPRRAAFFYDSVWGVDSLDVKIAESGELVRFSWRVLDANKAKTLSDKKLEPSLIAPSSHVKLVIPSLEKVGQLRQSSTPEAGKSYWMAFSNPGRVVKHGDRVDIMIGPFRAEGLTVD